MPRRARTPSSWRTPSRRPSPGAWDYREYAETASVAETTSSDIVKWEQEAVKRRLKTVDPNDSRCLIQNNGDITDVDYTQYFHGMFMDDETMMRNLEWWWNMRLSDLNLSTRDNTIPLSASMAKLLEHNTWLLLPSLEIVKQFHEKIKRVNIEGMGSMTIGDRKGFPIIERGVFEYAFIPIGDGIKKRAIHRQINIKNAPGKDDFEIHFHPFPNLRSLKSNLHPKFAILEAGRRVNEMLSGALKRGGLSTLLEVQRELEKVDERLIMAGDIARGWTAPFHRDAMKDLTFNPPPGEQEDSGYQSDVTGPRPDRKRQRDEDEESEDEVSFDENGIPKTPPFRPTGSAKRGRGDKSPVPAKKGKGEPLMKKAVSVVGRIDHKARLTQWASEATRKSVAKGKKNKA